MDMRTEGETAKVQGKSSTSQVLITNGSIMEVLKMRNLGLAIIVGGILFSSARTEAATIYATCYAPEGQSSTLMLGQVSKDQPDGFKGAAWHYVYDLDKPKMIRVFAQSTQSEGLSAKDVDELAGTKWDEEMVLANEKGLIRSFAQYGFQWWITNLDIIDKKLYAVRSTGNPEGMLGGRKITTAYYWADCSVDVVE